MNINWKILWIIATHFFGSVSCLCKLFWVDRFWNSDFGCSLVCGAFLWDPHFRSSDYKEVQAFFLAEDFCLLGVSSFAENLSCVLCHYYLRTYHGRNLFLQQIETYQAHHAQGRQKRLKIIYKLNTARKDIFPLKTKLGLHLLPQHNERKRVKNRFFKVRCVRNMRKRATIARLGVASASASHGLGSGLRRSGHIAAKEEV